jgi:hypothetical protein
VRPTLHWSRSNQITILPRLEKAWTDMELRTNAEILANSAAGLSDFDTTMIKDLKLMEDKRLEGIDRMAMHDV